MTSRRNRRYTVVCVFFGNDSFLKTFDSGVFAKSRFVSRVVRKHYGVRRPRESHPGRGYGIVRVRSFRPVYCWYRMVTLSRRHSVYLRIRDRRRRFRVVIFYA